MKLIQLNTWEGRLGRNLYKFIERQQADILMLQEVLSSPEGKTYYFDELQTIKEKSQLAYDFFSPLTGNVHQGKQTYFGNAIVSRDGFESTYQEDTLESYKENWDAETDTDDIKLFQHAVINPAPGKFLNLVNYHGHNSHGQKQGNELTAKHCQQIADYIGTLAGPVILAGDFNLAPDSESLKPLNTMLKNLCIENAIQTTRNPLANSDIVVDYIWVSHDMTVQHFEVLPDMVSDHAALLLEFEV